MISGAFNMSLNYIPRGAFCWINGFVGQLTVQACDLSTLAIALVTFFVLKSKTGGEAIMASIAKRIWYIIGLIWGIPLCTAITAEFLIGYAPTTGNWCWIAGTPLPRAIYVRYGLTHGPRILIFITILFTYSYVFVVVRKRFLESAVARRANTGAGSVGEISSMPQGYKSPTNAPWSNVGSPSVAVPATNDGAVPSNLQINPPSPASATVSPSTPISTSSKKPLRSKEEKNIENAIYRLMLYPSAYILLWVGGMVNRAYDAAGQTNTVALYLQILTQFLPFVDSIIYGFTVRKAFLERSKLAQIATSTFVNRSKDKSFRDNQSTNAA
ncbi:hypothetical protein HK102_004635 [Quaeritorhiza haematococci]|nr:hypothetical protein HK102_004635 [Quaeritorhiza haematococci]